MTLGHWPLGKKAPFRRAPFASQSAYEKITRYRMTAVQLVFALILLP
jgi:hypothetical protein